LLCLIQTICTDKQVFPSLEFIGWYTVAPRPTARHITLHEQVRVNNQRDLLPKLTESQFTGYCSTPLLLVLQPSLALITSSDVNAQALPFKAYEPTIELRDRKSRSVYIEVPYNVETGEAERIAVDWTARGGGSGTSRKRNTSRCPLTMLIPCDSGIASANAAICREDATRAYSRSGQICNKRDSRYAILEFFFS